VPKTGSLIYLDLGISSSTTEYPHLGPRLTTPLPLEMSIAIGMDRTSVFLVLNIGLLNERLHDVGLTSKHIATFPLETQIYFP